MRSFRLIFSGLCLIAALAALSAAVICLLNPHRAELYLLDIFSIPLTSAVLAMTILLILLRQKWPAIVSVMASLVFLISVWPQAMPSQAPPDPSAPAVRAMFANLLIRNMTPENLLPWVAAQKPDVIALVEVNNFVNQTLLDGLRPTYPYQFVRYDMVVASRYPLLKPERHPAGFALLTATIKAPSGDIRLAVAHLTRPWPFSADQPTQMARLSQALRTQANTRFILVGDFNTAPSAVLINDLKRALNLHSAGAYNGTWPSFLPGFGRVTIDNAFASQDINLSRRRTGPFNGSDHRPIVVDI
ncbi:MAG: endonuclease/exonuclease/phosphatase family protein, partial [Asticcacaulis sp.]